MRIRSIAVAVAVLGLVVTLGARAADAPPADGPTGKDA